MLMMLCVAPVVVDGEEAEAVYRDSPLEGEGQTEWTAPPPKTEGFAVVGYLPEWRFGGTDWSVSQLETNILMRA